MAIESQPSSTEEKEWFCIGVSRYQSLLVDRRDQIQETIHKGHFRHWTFVTLNWKYFSKPLHMLINRTNQIASFDQLMKRLRDHLSNICCMRDTAATVMQLLSFGFFLWERLPLFRFALRVDRILLKISFPFPRSTCYKWHPLCELHFQGVQILLILANFLTETGWY